MNILVCGASGFIAGQIVTDLLLAGHAVICCVRNTSYAKTLFPNTTVLSCDYIHDTNTSDWEGRLKNIDIVINCVGILYHPNKKIIWAVHYDTPKALFDACVKMNIKKIIQISALGVDKSDVDYAKSKKAADDYLLSLNIPSIILRPSLVYGRGSYGGSSLFRGLAGLPYIIPVPGLGTQEFQPIHLNDLSTAIVHLIESSPSQNVILNAAGPSRITLNEILLKMRSWLGFAKAKVVHIPLVLIRLGAFLGDFIPYSALNSTSYKMLIQNNITHDLEVQAFHKTIGFIPRDFISGLDSQPSTVQDHWHARLYWVKPILQASISFTWIFTALCSAWFYPTSQSYALLTQIGIASFLQPILLYGASALDVFIGITVLCNYRTKQIGMLQLAVVIAYTALITWTLPHLWLDPLGPIVKNIPFIAAILVFLALESDR